ncbi:hypothetical protein NHX12_013213 [Muraenolepis orangiensis]|uniref:Uncharacterized protein n=1 Tax=Muraenolepis orangiensis TaxID=630683 RepID=A0A9Q0DEF3_9TELE|nr:hypothetical protein NHX12_013213 [Muraenolepis orangiensis]
MGLSSSEPPLGMICCKAGDVSTHRTKCLIRVGVPESPPTARCLLHCNGWSGGDTPQYRQTAPHVSDTCLTWLQRERDEPVQ